MAHRPKAASKNGGWKSSLKNYGPSSTVTFDEIFGGPMALNRRGVTPSFGRSASQVGGQHLPPASFDSSQGTFTSWSQQWSRESPVFESAANEKQEKTNSEDGSSQAKGTGLESLTLESRHYRREQDNDVALTALSAKVDRLTSMLEEVLERLPPKAVKRGRSEHRVEERATAAVHGTGDTFGAALPQVDYLERGAKRARVEARSGFKSSRGGRDTDETSSTAGSVVTLDDQVEDDAQDCIYYDRARMPPGSQLDSVHSNTSEVHVDGDPTSRAWPSTEEDGATEEEAFTGERTLGDSTNQGYAGLLADARAKKLAKIKRSQHGPAT